MVGIIVPGPPIPLTTLHIICNSTVLSNPPYSGAPTNPFEIAIIIRPRNTISLLLIRVDSQLTTGQEIAYVRELTPIIYPEKLSSIPRLSCKNIPYVGPINVN